MPVNKELENSQWTERHDAFCLENKITPAAKFLWQWLIRGGKVGEETEPDLSEFNDWVQKHRGKGYSRPTLKTALAQLVECRVVQIIKKFTWAIARIITRPLDWLKPRKNFPNRPKTFNLPTPNDLTAEQGVDSSSNTSFSCEAVAECENAGIPFDPEKSPEILEYTLESVKAAIALFKERGGHETDWRGRRKIRNPQGWLLKCLRLGWAEEVNSWSFASLLAALGVKL
jgi:hypothetical protein